MDSAAATCLALQVRGTGNSWAVGEQRRVLLRKTGELLSWLNKAQW